MITDLNRRQFLATAAAAAAFPWLGLPQASTNAQPLCVFTKALQSLSYEELASRIAALGFSGIEAPIRKGGHIEPEAVPEELPKMVAALKKHGLELTIMTSSVNSVTQPHTETTLRIAAGLGIRQYRMQYFTYDADRPIRQQVREIRGHLRDLAALNLELGIQGLYQNHAGERYFGAGLWDLEQALRGIDSAAIAVCYDVRHATVEGGQCWPVPFQLLRDKIAALYAKDFTWGTGPGPQNTPLGKGRVDYPRFFEMVQESGFDGPISLHVEYIDHRDPKLVPEHLAAMERDLATLKTWL